MQTQHTFKTLKANPAYPGVFDIEPTELNEARSLAGNNFKIVDVREVNEFTGELGHIPGAELIVLGTLPEAVKKLNAEQTLVMVCRSGGRSAKAAAFLLENKFNKVYNLRGGMLLWNELHLPKK